MIWNRITLFLIVLFTLRRTNLVAAKKSPRSSSSGRHRPSRTAPPTRGSHSKRRVEAFEESDDFDFPGDSFSDEESEDEEVDDYVPRPRRTGAPQRSSSAPSRRPPSSGDRRRYADDYDYDAASTTRVPGGRKSASSRGPQRSRRSNRSGRVVQYRRAPPPSSLSRGLEALRNSMPDPTAVREAAVSSLNVAREATSGLSANLYREVKGLTSSELEQVMLKATRPDDTAVKGKHVERLVGVTYQISSRYDIYDAVLRKLWAKMAEKDWRTTIKALYILHRFSADGAPEHAPALKARLRELRRTRDPKRKEKYFNSKQLLAGDDKVDSAPYRAFMSRYAHYVLLRAQCFGGMFDEIGSLPTSPKDKKKATLKPAPSTSLRTEHLEAAKLLLKAAMACQLKDGEDCENTAIAAERVASDLIGLSASVAKALNRVLKEDDCGGVENGLLQRWCEFYDEELSKQTRVMVKKTTPKLDPYGLFLPSRMGPTVSQELLEKGLHLQEKEVQGSDLVEKEHVPEANSEDQDSARLEPDDSPLEDQDIEDDDGSYEYDEDEYYDDEDDL